MHNTSICDFSSNNNNNNKNNSNSYKPHSKSLFGNIRLDPMSLITSSSATSSNNIERHEHCSENSPLDANKASRHMKQKSYHDGKETKYADAVSNAFSSFQKSSNWSKLKTRLVFGYFLLLDFSDSPTFLSKATTLR
jgi:hypothetical protein